MGESGIHDSRKPKADKVAVRAIMTSLTTVDEATDDLFSVPEPSVLMLLI